MKKSLYIFLFFVFVGNCFAQNDTVPAEFSGGAIAMMKFIQQNLKYPQEAIDAGVSFNSMLKFVVNENGKLSKIQILKGVKGCPQCDTNAVHLVKSMPKWNPALVNGKPVKTYFKLPIEIRIQ